MFDYYDSIKKIQKYFQKLLFPTNEFSITFNWLLLATILNVPTIEKLQLHNFKYIQLFMQLVWNQ
jgi:hypothetical protein